MATTHKLLYVPFLIFSYLAHCYKWILPHFYFPVSQPAQYLRTRTHNNYTQVQFVASVTCGDDSRNGTHMKFCHSEDIKAGYC